jgi:uncharacterized protein with PIN domain
MVNIICYAVKRKRGGGDPRIPLRGFSGMKSKRIAFLCDRMLGRLCRKLRLLGCDAKLNPEKEAGRFFLNAEFDGRIAVTRARSLRDRPGNPPVVLVAEDTDSQLRELFSKLGEKPDLRPFTRCMECNVPLEDADAESVKGSVPAYISERFERFHQCPSCGRVYWEGSHYEAMAEEVERLRRLVE